jgi:hypothetical protein
VVIEVTVVAFRQVSLRMSRKKYNKLEAFVFKICPIVHNFPRVWKIVAVLLAVCPGF